MIPDRTCAIFFKFRCPKLLYNVYPGNAVSGMYLAKVTVLAYVIKCDSKVLPSCVVST
jgi:hypothetical protein